MLEKNPSGEKPNFTGSVQFGKLYCGKKLFDNSERL
jgi:hypothetical protein